MAGGGSLLVFPALLAVGFSPLAANVTNSVAQWPGYLGVVAGARHELPGQGRRLALDVGRRGVRLRGRLRAAAGTAGRGVRRRRAVLVLLASVLLGLQPWLKRWIPPPEPGTPDRLPVLLPAIFFAAIYGGYFGGALGVILIATLSLCAGDELKRLNATKAVLSLVIATVTVVIFALRAPVDWASVALLAPSTLVGGYLGAAWRGGCRRTCCGRRWCCWVWVWGSTCSCGEGRGMPAGVVHISRRRCTRCTVCTDPRGVHGLVYRRCDRRTRSTTGSSSARIGARSPSAAARAASMFASRSTCSHPSL